PPLGKDSGLVAARYSVLIVVLTAYTPSRIQARGQCSVPAGTNNAAPWNTTTEAIPLASRTGDIVRGPLLGPRWYGPHSCATQVVVSGVGCPRSTFHHNPHDPGAFAVPCAS